MIATGETIQTAARVGRLERDKLLGELELAFPMAVNGLVQRIKRNKPPLEYPFNPLH